MFSHTFLLFLQLLLVFSQNCYLLVSQRQYIIHAPPCFWNRTRGFLKSKMLVGTWQQHHYCRLFPFLPSAESICCERPFGLNMTSYLSSHKNPRADTFLHQPSYAVQPKYGIIKVKKKVDCRLSLTAFLLTLRSKAIVRPFLTTNASVASVPPVYTTS